MNRRITSSPLRLYCRRFGTKCAGCDRLVDKNDLVRRARDKVFHVDCFCCTVCQKRLDTGEELYILNGNRFICKQDYMNCRPGECFATTAVKNHARGRGVLGGRSVADGRPAESV